MSASYPLSDHRSLRSSWQSFFYREEVPFSLALLRILLPLVLLIVVVPRWVHSRELYSTDGAAAPLAINYGWPDFFPEPNGTVAVALVSVLAVSLLMSAAGWWTRTSLLISAALFGYLNMLDCLSSITKYSVISTHFLVLLGLSNCGAIWSVDSLLRPSSLPRRRIFGAETTLPVAVVWPRRLIQLLIGLIYFGAATTKLQTEAYFTSDQLRWWMMTNVNRANPMGEWLSAYPSILIAMAYAAIVWQIIFVFISWRGIGRLFALGFGATFHFSTAPLLGIYVFPMVMISSYVSFFDEKDMLQIGRWARRLGLDQWLTRPVHVPKWAASGLAYATVLLVTSAVGVAAEYVIDPYGERRPEGKHPLPVLEAGFFERIPREPESIRETDKYHTVTIGTDVLGGVMMNSRNEFQRGERFLVQVSLTLLHGDQWIECNLLDPEGRLVQQVGQVVTRERLRAEWQFKVPTTLPPGTYSVVIRSGGQEIARRPVEIH